MCKVKGLLGEYKLIGEEYYPKSPKVDDNFASFNDKGVQKIEENKDYAKTIGYFDQAIEIYKKDNPKCDLKYANQLQILYRNSAMAKIELGLFDLVEFVRLSLHTGNFEEFTKSLKNLKCLSNLSNFFK